MITATRGFSTEIYVDVWNHHVDLVRLAAPLASGYSDACASYIDGVELPVAGGSVF